MSDERTPFEDKTQSVLRDSAEHLDGHTRSRLTQARHAALAEIERHRSQRVRWLLPAGAAAAAVLAVFLLQGRIAVAPVTTEPVAAVEDIELMTAEDSLEMYENLEFYAWLDQAASEDFPAEPTETESGVG